MKQHTLPTSDLSINEILLLSDQVEKALVYFSPEKIFLNTDCGFGCFAERCVNDETNAFEKIKQMVAAANMLRLKYA